MNEKMLDLLLLLKEQEYSVDDEEIIVWISFYSIREFTEFFSYSTFDEGGVDVKLQKDCIALDIKDMLEQMFVYEEVEYIIKKLKEWE